MHTENLDERTITIVVTDSGLGGLSVVAELEKVICNENRNPNVELIFFNAVNDKSYGYNDMKNILEQALLFDKVLNSIEYSCNPDLILIACNTLSIVYPETDFSKNSKTRIEGIVNAGVEYFYEKMDENIESPIILFGTPTTVNSKKHKDMLVAKGIAEERIVYQACPLLESEIQDDPNSDAVVKMINEFVEQAKEKIFSCNNRVFAGLCCTHYGYSFDQFNMILKKKFGNDADVLNPNNRMVESILDLEKNGIENPLLKVEVVSKVEILHHEQIALTKILADQAPKTIKALHDYKRVPELF